MAALARWKQYGRWARPHVQAVLDSQSNDLERAIRDMAASEQSVVNRRAAASRAVRLMAEGIELAGEEEQRGVGITQTELIERLSASSPLPHLPPPI